MHLLNSWTNLRFEICPFLIILFLLLSCFIWASGEIRTHDNSALQVQRSRPLCHRSIYFAEAEGFEPPDPVRVASFQDWCNQPTLPNFQYITLKFPHVLKLCVIICSLRDYIILLSAHRWATYWGVGRYLYALILPNVPTFQHLTDSDVLYIWAVRTGFEPVTPW